MFSLWVLFYKKIFTCNHFEDSTLNPILSVMGLIHRGLTVLENSVLNILIVCHPLIGISFYHWSSFGLNDISVINTYPLKNFLSSQLLYVSTSEWVLRTLFAGWKLVYHIILKFSSFLPHFEGKKTGLQPVSRPVEQSFGFFRKVPKKGAKNGANVYRIIRGYK